MRRFLLAAALALTAAAAQAKDITGLPGPYLVPYIGAYNALNQDDQDNPAVFGVEYRFSDIFYGLRPTVGMFISSETDKYGYAGINWDIPLIDHQLFLTPNFMVGLYDDGNSSVDLGGPIEFRSGLELSYQFQNQHRVGIAFNHISNASIYDKNPGTETLLVNWAIPVGALR